MKPTINHYRSVIVEHVMHKSEKRIKLTFRYDELLIDAVKKIPGCVWSKTMNAWHVPDNEYSKASLQGLINETGVTISVIPKNEQKKTYTKIDKIPAEAHAKQIERFTKWLKGQRYSENTVKSYLDALSVFLKFCDSKDLKTIDNEDVVRFNTEYILCHNYSASYQNQVITAIKLFFKIIEEKIILEQEIVRPRRAQKLPDILSQEEIEMILKSCINLKHKSALALIYACGLRRSELIHLQLVSVDSKRKLLVIKEGKGKKDRVVPLPERMIEMLREYFKLYKPKTWLFEGSKPGEQYSESSLQHVFKRVTKKASIKKAVSLHTLRHSYATHLLENGTDLRFIQEILGHKNSKTTEIYTHVSRKSIEKIKSPFENLKL